jgi:hypothetical protein
MKEIEALTGEFYADILLGALGHDTTCRGFLS